MVIFMNLPKRKPNRLKDYDYRQNGAYFITICTKDKKEILSRIVAGTVHSNERRGEHCSPEISRNHLTEHPNEVRLTAIGEIAEKGIQGIDEHYKNIFVDNYVIMPNHIHLIIRIDNNECGIDGRTLFARIIAQPYRRVIRTNQTNVSTK